MSAIKLRTTRGNWLTPIIALAGCGVAFTGAEALFYAQPLATLAVLLGTPATVVLGAFGLAATGRGALVVRALALAALVIVIAALRAQWDHTTATPMLAMMIAGPIGLGALALWWWGDEYLAVDVPAGVAHMVTIKQRVSLPLDQLGPLSIAEKSRQGQRNFRIVHYELMAAGLPDIVVFSSHDRAAVDQRRARIEQLIATSAVRRILATAVTEPGAFRAAPDLAVRVHQTVTDPALLEQALAELARDHDARVRAGAAEVASGEHR